MKLEFTVYAIKSVSRKYLYVGLTSNLTERLDRHNKAQNKTTRPYVPFVLIHTKSFTTRSAAREYEKYLKSGCGKEYLKLLV